MIPAPTIAYMAGAVSLALMAHDTGVWDGMDLAQEVVEAVPPSPYMTPLIATIRLTSLALIAVARGDVESAREQYTHLESMRGTILPPGVGVSADRVLGLLSVTMGRLDQATAHFEDALAMCRRAGRKDELPGVCYDYADALLQRNGGGDRAKAMSLLDESLAIASELGMRPLMARVAERLDRV